MSNYRGNRVPGGTYFFTVNLLERKSTLLTEHIAELREAVCIVRKNSRFILIPTIKNGQLKKQGIDKTEFQIPLA